MTTFKIGIHNTKGSFSEHWVNYCNIKQISYKLVDCCNNDIFMQLGDCNAVMWHFSQNSPKAILFAKQLLYSIEATGRKVFPDFNTMWHFDDKLGQKYLLEAIGAPLVNTVIFYSRNDALQWAYNTDFPKVFKLTNGAGSQNVRMAKNRQQACNLIRKAFGKGFPAYDSIGSLNERWRKFKLGKTDFIDLLEGIARFVVHPPYSRIRGRENGYIYFQDFIPGNDHDIRVIVIGDKAFAIKRMVRANDFRASGSGDIHFDRQLFDESTIRLSFNLAVRLKSQCVAFDFVHQDNIPLLVEISYGFSPEGYSNCPGYWDKELKWHNGKFNPYGWMVEGLLNR
jgi:glutathione synthase/RimK-type ligase-like ATP-grasp enzyme